MEIADAKGECMKLSLQLVAERLSARGFQAHVLNDADWQFERLRLLPFDDEPLVGRTLYVCDRAPDCARASNGSSDSSYAIAPVGQLQSSRFEPCLVVEDATNAGELLNLIADVCDELAAAVSHARELIWEADGLAGIVQVLSDLVGNPVYIVDSSFKVMAILDDPDMEEMSVNWMHAAKRGYLSYDVVAGLIRSDELHEIERSNCSTMVRSQFFYTPFANYNLRADGKVRGHLFVVEMYKSVTKGDLELIDLIAPLAMRALLADPQFQAQRGPLYERFVVDWLEGNLHDSAYVRRQLDALNFDAESCSVVVAIKLPEEGDFRRQHLAQLLEDRQGCRSVSHGEHVVALFQLHRHKEKESVLRKVRSICHSQHCRAFVSDVQDRFLDTPRAYRQACEAVRISEAMGLEEEVVCYGDVAAYQPYLNFSSADELDAFCHPAVVTLRVYDRAHAVQLLPTLSAFLKNDRDVQIAAAKLFIHRNTLSYRLKKILEMCPLDLDDFNTRHRLLESILIVENYDGITTHLQE